MWRSGDVKGQPMNVRSELPCSWPKASAILRGCAAATGILLLGLARPSGPVRARSAADVSDLVFVSEDLATSPENGCDAVSVFSVASAEPLYRGEHHVSPGRLAATSDFSLVLANHSNIGSPETEALGSFLYVLRGDPGDRSRWWTDGLISGARFAPLGGIAILPDDETLLAATKGGSGLPHAVSRFHLSEISGGRIGPEHGARRFGALPVEIIPTADGRQAHVVTEDARVHTLDVAGMMDAAPVIPLEPFGPQPLAYPGQYANLAHATVSADGRYLVTNRWGAGSLNVADLARRTAWTLPLPGNVEFVGGVALNHVGENRDVLALHAAEVVIVYEFRPQGPLAERGLTAVGTPPADVGAVWGPSLSVAWSGDGHKVIAATNRGTADFQVIEVADRGATLGRTIEWSPCASDSNLPNDILTENGRLAPPLIPPRFDLYLPLALVDPPCQPEHEHADVVLVIDASSSMAETTAGGPTKLDAARAAAGLFLDQLSFDQDQAALVTFNRDVLVRQPLTGDRAALDRAMAGIELAQETRIHLGIEAAHAELAGPRHRAGSSRVMIVLTDGRANPLPADLAVERAALAKADGIAVFTIGLGEDLDREALVRMASRPDHFYHAPTGAELAEIYGAIAVAIPCPVERTWGGRP